MPLVGAESQKESRYVPAIGAYVYGEYRVTGKWGEKSFIYQDPYGNDLKYVPGTTHHQFGPDSWAELLGGNGFGGEDKYSFLGDILSLGTTSATRAITQTLGNPEFYGQLNRLSKGQVSSPAELYQDLKIVANIALAMVPVIGGALDVAFNIATQVVEATLASNNIGRDLFGVDKDATTADIGKNFGSNVAGFIIPTAVESIGVTNAILKRPLLIDLTKRAEQIQLKSQTRSGYENLNSLKSASSAEEFQVLNEELKTLPSRTRITDLKESMNFGNYDRVSRDIFNTIEKQTFAALNKPVVEPGGKPYRGSGDYTKNFKATGDAGDQGRYNYVTRRIRSQAGPGKVEMLDEVNLKIKGIVESGILANFATLSEAVTFITSEAGRALFKLELVPKTLIFSKLKLYIIKNKIAQLTITKHLMSYKRGLDKFNKVAKKPIAVVDLLSKIAENMGAEGVGVVSEKSYEEIKHNIKEESYENKLQEQRANKMKGKLKEVNELQRLKRALEAEGGTVVNSNVIVGYRVLQQAKVGVDALVQIVFNPVTTGAISTGAKNHGGKKPVYVRATASQLASLQSGGMRYYLQTGALSRGGKLPVGMEMVDLVLGNAAAGLPLPILNKMLMIANRIRLATVKGKVVAQSKSFKAAFDKVLEEGGSEANLKGKKGLRSIVNMAGGNSRVGRIAATSTVSGTVRIPKTAGYRASHKVSAATRKVNRAGNLFKSANGSPKSKK